jgi:hypothetical protein
LNPYLDYEKVINGAQHQSKLEPFNHHHPIYDPLFEVEAIGLIHLCFPRPPNLDFRPK